MEHSLMLNSAFLVKDKVKWSAPPFAVFKTALIDFTNSSFSKQEVFGEWYMPLSCTSILNLQKFAQGVKFPLPFSQ